jgi:hypothetical protein
VYLAFQFVQAMVIRPKYQQQIVWSVVLAIAVDVVKVETLFYLRVKPRGVYVRMCLQPNGSIIP